MTQPARSEYFKIMFVIINFSMVAIYLYYYYSLMQEDKRRQEIETTCSGMHEIKNGSDVVRVSNQRNTRNTRKKSSRTSTSNDGDFDSSKI